MNCRHAKNTVCRVGAKQATSEASAHLTFFGSADILVGTNEMVKQWPTRMSALPTTLLAMSAKCEMRPRSNSEITEDGKPVLRHNSLTVEPGEVLKSVSAGNRIYARARSDYIHPLCGLDGAVLTKDWPAQLPARFMPWPWPGSPRPLHCGKAHAPGSSPTCRCCLGPMIFPLDSLPSLW